MPDTPRNIKVNSSGCPLDTDGDGVYDYLDKCPDTPRASRWTATAAHWIRMATVFPIIWISARNCSDLKVDADGCPILMKKSTSITLDIQFDTNKADIKPEYHNRLKEVADFLTTYPQTKAVIEGHTDSVGSSAYNQKLSQRRADNVVSYLVKNFNSDPSRLSAKGYGEDKR